MTISLADRYISRDQSSCEATYDVMCLVKRRTYELAFAVPRAPHTLTHGAQLCLHVRLKTQCQTGGFTLTLAEVEQCYEDLLQIREYMQSERQKIGTSKPLGAGVNRSHIQTAPTAS
jgi:hypothetical protein